MDKYEISVPKTIFDFLTSQYTWNNTKIWVLSPNMGGPIDPLNIWTAEYKVDEKNWPSGWPFLSPTYGTIVYLGSTTSSDREHKHLSPELYLAELDLLRKMPRKKRLRLANSKKRELNIHQRSPST
jgi:hypothetical protein